LYPQDLKVLLLHAEMKPAVLKICCIYVSINFCLPASLGLAGIKRPNRKNFSWQCNIFDVEPTLILYINK